MSENQQLVKRVREEADATLKDMQVRLGMRAWYLHTTYAEYQSCMV